LWVTQDYKRNQLSKAGADPRKNNFCGIQAALALLSRAALSLEAASTETLATDSPFRSGQFTEEMMSRADHVRRIRNVSSQITLSQRPCPSDGINLRHVTCGLRSSWGCSLGLAAFASRRPRLHPLLAASPTSPASLDLYAFSSPHSKIYNDASCSDSDEPGARG